MDVKRFLSRLESDRNYRGQIVEMKSLASREPVFGEPAEPLPPNLVQSLEEMGIHKLYSHQAEAIDAVRGGEDIVIVTSTASGKTLCYNLPVLEALPYGAKALYIFPTKALAQDQLRGILRFKESDPSLALLAGTYDGDTPRDTRRKLRDEGNVILTNPDMLHAAILPHHPSWGRFFASLKYVVIDEIHTYRGIFGSNVANVIKRLRRICRHYGSDPQFICCSATIANPGPLAEKLIGKRVRIVDTDGSPRGEKKFLLWNPPRIAETMERRSANSEAQYIMTELVKNRIQTIAFAKARVVTELIYRYVCHDLERYGQKLADSIRAYRGGYLPQDRREIEQRLFNGDLLGVVATNALELGIDIGSLEACLIVGYPGTIASTWQQAGRAGRKNEESLVILVAHNTPIDQYLVQHPDYFFEQSPENAVVDPENPYVLLGHLRAAAFELPITIDEEKWFGEYAPALLDILSEDGQVVYRRNRWFWTGRGYPADDVSLRNISENTYTIVDTTDGNKVIGTIDELSAFMQLHTEAIYMHDGDTYFVSKLAVDEKVAYVHRADVDYYTQAVTERKVQVDSTELERKWREAQLCFGDVCVTYLTYMFKKIKFYDRDSIGFGKIDLPPSTLDTCALWLMPSLSTLRKVREFGRSPVEGLLGVANVVTEVIPLFAMCDPSDIGSVVDSGNTGVPTLFVFDRFPGGIGFAQRGYEMAEEVFTACLELIQSCQCTDGCPSCVGSPIPPFAQNDPDGDVKGRIPDKEAALVILHDLLGLEPYVPRPAALGTSSGISGMALTEAAMAEERERPPAKPLPENVELRIRRKMTEMK